MKHLLAMDPEAHASTHIHHLRLLPWRPPTSKQETHVQPPKLSLQGGTHKRDVTLTPSSPYPANKSLGFHPEKPSHTHQSRKSTMRKQRPVDAAIIGTDPRVMVELSPGSTPLQETTCKTSHLTFVDHQASLSARAKKDTML
jgi:hypothetical protein